MSETETTRHKYIDRIAENATTIHQEMSSYIIHKDVKSKEQLLEAQKDFFLALQQYEGQDKKLSIQEEADREKIHVDLREIDRNSDRLFTLIDGLSRFRTLLKAKVEEVINILHNLRSFTDLRDFRHIEQLRLLSDFEKKFEDIHYIVRTYRSDEKKQSYTSIYEIRRDIEDLSQDAIEKFPLIALQISWNSFSESLF